MKRRIFTKFLAVFSALVMLVCAFGCSNQTQNKSKYGEIKNIIIIIGDGMGLEHITAGQLYENKQYAFTNWNYTAVNTDSVDIVGKGFKTTDSAAGGTALATGNLTVNGYVGKEYHGYDVQTILDYAKEKGKSTGVVTTDTLYGATPASFSAHAMDRNSTAEIVNSQIASGVDLLCGHANANCTNKAEDIANNGYTLCTDFADIENAKTADKAYWQFKMSGYSAKNQLEDVTPHALDFLDDNENGFVLMIEQAHIDKYSHDNDIDGVVKSMASLNNTVEAVMNWMGNRKDTAILITADHETGGLAVSSKNVARLEIETKNGGLLYYNWESGSHTDSKVGLFVYGINPDFSKFSFYSSRHLIKNIEVFTIMNDLLNDGKAYAK